MIIDYKKTDNNAMIVRFDIKFKEIEYIIIKNNIFDKIKCIYSKEKDQIIVDLFDLDTDCEITLLILSINNIDQNNVYKIKEDLHEPLAFPGAIINSCGFMNTNRGIHAVINKRN